VHEVLSGPQHRARRSDRTRKAWSRHLGFVEFNRLSPRRRAAIKKRREAENAQRAAENEELAKVARFWRKEKSAIQLGYDRPVNRQAVKDLSFKEPEPGNSN
jgi:hypothetical protein